MNFFEYQETFRKNLKYYRKEANITQEKLAEMCDCSKVTIEKIENKKQKPSFKMIFKIAEALKITPADLFLKDASRAKNEFKKELELFISKL